MMHHPADGPPAGIFFFRFQAFGQNSRKSGGVAGAGLPGVEEK